MDKDMKILEEIQVKAKLLERRVENLSLELTRLTDIIMGLQTRYEKIDDELRQ